MRGGGRRGGGVGAFVLALALLSAGCSTMAAVPPRPCDQLDDRPGLREELRILRALPGDPFVHTRWYALDADESCAGNRALGAPRITPAHKPPSCWARLWRWLRG